MHDESPGGAGGEQREERGHRVFELHPAEFSRTDASWLPLKQWEEIESGSVTPAEVLRTECRRRGEPAPTSHDEDAFAASYEASKEELAETTRKFGDQLNRQLGDSVSSIAEAASRAFGLSSTSFGGALAPQPPPLQYEPFDIPTIDMDSLATIADVQQAIVAGFEQSALALTALVAHAEGDAAKRKSDHWWMIATFVVALIGTVATVVSLFLR